MKALVTGGAGLHRLDARRPPAGRGPRRRRRRRPVDGKLANLADARADRDHDLKVHQVDIRDPAVVDLIARREPEVVFHLAAQADVRVSVARPAFDAEVNVVGSLNVLEGARLGGARKVVFASSGGTIYGEPDPADLPVRESHPQQPRVALRRGQEGRVRLPPRLPRAARPRVHVAGAGQRLRPPAGPPRRGRAWWRSSPGCCSTASRARSSATARRPATSSTSTTSSTPSSGPPTAGSGLLCNIGTGHGDLGERALRTRWPTRPASREPAAAGAGRVGELARVVARPGPGQLHLGLGAVDRPARRASARSSPGSAATRSGPEQVLGGRADDLGRARSPCRSQAGSTPRTTAAATPLALPITSSAAAASSSTTHTSVTWSSRPWLSSVPRRSTTARMPAQPMATSVRPRRHGRPKVSDTITATSTPRRAAEPVADAAGRAVAVLGQERGPALVDVGQVDAGVGADEPVLGLADDEVAPPAEDAHRLGLDDRPCGPAGRRGRSRTIAPSALDTTFWVTTTTSPSLEVRLRRRR